MKPLSGGETPLISVWNRQHGVKLDRAKLERLANTAADECRHHPGAHSPVLGTLEEVEVTLVSDREIARVHREFMQIPGATDVITFGHGEIVVSATTAVREARAHGESTDREVFRYIVHGLLHLNGHEDAKEDEAAAMWQAQEAVVARVWPF